MQMAGVSWRPETDLSPSRNAEDATPLEPPANHAMVIGRGLLRDFAILRQRSSARSFECCVITVIGSLTYQTMIDETLKPAGYCTRSRLPPFH